MLVKETLEMRPVPERLRAAGTRRGKGADQVAMSEAVRQLPSAHILVNKARVKAVAGSDRIDDLDLQCWTSYLPGRAHGNRPFRS